LMEIEYIKNTNMMLKVEIIVSYDSYVSHSCFAWSAWSPLRLRNWIHIGILWGGSEERLRQLQKIQVQQCRTLQKAKNTSKVEKNSSRMFEEFLSISFNIHVDFSWFLYLEPGWQWLLWLCSLGALTWGKACWSSIVRVWIQSDPFPHFMLLCGKGGAGRTIKCTNWGEVAAASKYWWDSGTVDETHDTVMLVNISESKFPRTARNMPGNSSLRSPVCISRGPCRSLYGSDLWWFSKHHICFQVKTVCEQKDVLFGAKMIQNMSSSFKFHNG
jgi:hypothetical protein